MRIVTTAFLAASFVSTVIDQLSRRYPRIVFHLVTGAAGTQYGELRGRNLDLLITRRLSSAVDAGLDLEFLFDDSFVVAAGAQNQWAGQRKIALADLVNEPWVLPPPEGGIATVAMEAFRACGLEAPRATVFALASETRMSLLTPGRFLSIFPTSVMKFPTTRPGIKVLPVELAVPRVPVGTVTLRNRTLSPVVRLFIDSARDAAKPLAKRKW